MYLLVKNSIDPHSKLIIFVFGVHFHKFLQYFIFSIRMAEDYSQQKNSRARRKFKLHSPALDTTTRRKKIVYLPTMISSTPIVNAVTISDHLRLSIRISKLYLPTISVLVKNQYYLWLKNEFLIRTLQHCLPLQRSIPLAP